MRQFALFAAISMVVAIPVTADAQSSKVVKQLQSENASLKRTVTALQRSIRSLSARLGRLEKKSASSSTGASSSGTAALDNRLRKLENVVLISSSGVHIKAQRLKLEAVQRLDVKGGATVTVKGGSKLTMDSGGPAVINGSVVRLGGNGGRPIARVGDTTLSAPVVGGPGKISTGSPRVYAN
jgi:predicted RNase H-like nuclease (RuvC/YqgF family)